MGNVLNVLITIKAIIQDADVDNVAIGSSVKYLEYCTDTIEIKGILSELSRNNYGEALFLIDKYLIVNDNSDIIYHYCSVEALYNIVNSKVLWLSDSDYMNDKFEGRWVDKAFEGMDIPSNSIIPSDIKKRYENLDAKKQYIFCLSKNGDKLSQWRGYANDGKGVAIGFSKRALALPSIVTEVDDRKVLTTQSGLAEMIYCKKEQEKLLQKIIDSITNNEQIDSRLIFIKELSIKYKNPSFEEEEEIRIIYIPRSTTDIERFSEKKYRFSNKHIVGYYEFQLTNQGSYKDDLVPKIILGPKCTLKESDLQQFLQSFGLPKTEIQKSISSYR